MTAAHRQYDMIVFGAGIAGLWLAGTLKRAGYNVIVIEKDKAGGGQTLASQGMIHGGQKYVLQGKMTEHAAKLAAMPERWDSCLGGYGEIDLTAVKILSDTQIMWPAGSLISEAAVFGAAKLVNAKTLKLKKDQYPQLLQDKKKFKGPVYELPEKVLDTKSLMLALMQPLKGRILKGEVTELLPDGQVAISGIPMQAQLLIFTAGAGNETALSLLKVKEARTQRRPLRQVMVKNMPYAFYGHGIVSAPKPRVTITSHPVSDSIAYGEYIWYLGGSIAEEGAKLDEAATIAFAQKEMMDMFPDIDWQSKEWATWYGDRAEPFDPAGDLPMGPFVHQRGRVLMAWPSKLTFAPMLSDHVFAWLHDKDIHAAAKDAPPDLPLADIGSYPWEVATWSKF